MKIKPPIVVIFVLTWIIACVFFVKLGAQKQLNQVELGVFGKIPDFKFIERSGEEITEADLEGKVWIANFIFTRCAGPCPLMSGHMKKLQQKLTTEDRIRFVSFSVDPEFDTPEVLRVYADKFNADKKKWLFLTGEREKIYKMAIKHFFVGVGAEQLHMHHTILHSTKFILVDKDMQIRGYYDSLEPEKLNLVVTDALMLAGK